MPLSSLGILKDMSEKSVIEANLINSKMFTFSISFSDHFTLAFKLSVTM